MGSKLLLEGGQLHKYIQWLIAFTGRISQHL